MARKRLDPDPWTELSVVVTGMCLALWWAGEVLDGFSRGPQTLREVTLLFLIAAFVLADIWWVTRGVRRRNAAEKRERQRARRTNW